MKKELFFRLLSIIIYTISFGLCLFKYDWYLIIILILYSWANNIENKKYI